MAKYGFNFRATDGTTPGFPVTDGTDDTYVLEADTYPTTRASRTFGWSGVAPSGNRDRDSGVNAKLAGISFANDGSDVDFRIDLSGSLKVRMAGPGDATVGQSGAAIDIRDSAGSKDLVPSSGTLSHAGGEFYDPAETKHASAAAWVSSNAQNAAVSFTSYMVVRLKSGTATCIAHFEAEEEAAAGHTVTVNQVTETDLAQSLTARKTRTLGQNAETDLAQAIAWAPKHRLVAQAAETDLAQALTALKRIALGQPSESDSAQAIVWAPKIRIVGQASETDLAQGVTRSAITVAVGQVSETDSAQAITWNPKIRIIGIAAETDIAQTITTPVGNFRIGLRGDATNIYVTTEADLSQFEADAPEHGVRMKYLL